MPPKLLHGQCLLGFLLFPSILRRLRHPTLSQLALSLLSPIQRFWLRLTTSFLAFVVSTFSRPYLLSSEHIPASALRTVLLVVLERPSIILAAVICTVSNCFAGFVPFPYFCILSLWYNNVNQIAYFEVFNPRV